MSNGACDALAERFEQKRANGLRDIKFFLQNRDETEGEEICAEIGRLYEAVDAGRTSPIDMGDLAWSDKKVRR